MESRHLPAQNLNGDFSTVRAQLDRILAGPSFRTSKRYSRFLSYVVEETLNGRSDTVKERVIATEVFGRPPDYDSNVDPIVRVAAGEIRKRIAQYYVQPGHESELRIELHAGSYIPNFVRPVNHAATTAPAADIQAPIIPSYQPEPPEEIGSAPVLAVASKQILSLRRLYATLISVLFIASAGIWYDMAVLETGLEQFWKPFISGSASPFVCVPDILSVGQEPVPTLATDPTIREWVMGAEHVAYGDVTALTEISAPFHRAKRPLRVLMADSVNFSDLRGQPLVLIGGGDNPWAVRFLSGLKYTIHLDSSSSTNQILDTQSGSKAIAELGVKDRISVVNHDFAVISRFSNAAIGQPTLIVAGLGPYGTTAAAEFVTNPQYFAEFTQAAPKDWSQRNVQIVIKTEVVNGQSGPPHMVTFNVW